MKKSNRYDAHVDPEYQRWGRKYSQFPGVAECVRLIQSGKATGAWADIIVQELAENADACFTELKDAFSQNVSKMAVQGDVAMFIMMALEIARLPHSVEFLSTVLQAGDARFQSYAYRTLQAIDTHESRGVLFNALHIYSSNSA
jgi:hypothetical protein